VKLIAPASIPSNFDNAQISSPLTGTNSTFNRIYNFNAELFATYATILSTDESKVITGVNLAYDDTAVPPTLTARVLTAESIARIKMTSFFVNAAVLSFEAASVGSGDVVLEFVDGVTASDYIAAGTVILLTIYWN